MPADDPTGWPPPSPQVAELIEGFAVATLQDSGPIFEAVDRAVLDAAPERVLADPVLTDALRRANHANLTHWMAANAAAPGARVPANLGPEVIELARDIVRRGFDDTSLNSYRVGQNAALRFLIDRVFELSDDVSLIRELLDVCSRSIFTFVDDTVGGVEEQIGIEREALARGTHAERLAAVNLILEGAPISEPRASARLGYELSARQGAAVVWTEADDAGAGLEAAADEIARAAGAPRPLTVVAGTRTLWCWFSPPDGATAAQSGATAAPARRPDPDALEEGVFVAIGSEGRGIEGFRRSHMNALATQRLMRRARQQVRIAAYPEIEPVAVAAADEDLAVDFARRTLGGLAGGDPRLRETVLAYIRSDLNATAAAASLYAHRNTVLNRLERAAELLPEPLSGRAIEVGLALEIERWLGIPGEGEAA